ncbi:hypothetical protein [Fluviicola chungangensis]|uniref:Uncharacterized protein n=1 Tax=Fluviicola chungangensis TaxID=2597671 RepID=A0A556N2T9_9FLAO|nr:hypothetical protein [Fluviicola chungangensis]TSJ46514.1 hypothetical protein FO442_04965 [Fluviicola chungangensis]
MKSYLLSILLFSNLAFAQNDSILYENTGFLNDGKIGESKRDLKTRGLAPEKFVYTKVKYRLFKSKTGERIEKKYITKKGMTKHCWKTKKEGVYFYFQKGLVSAVLINSTKYKTDKGIRVGDNIEEMFAVYGKTVEIHNTAYYYSHGIMFCLNSSKNIEKIILTKTNQPWHRSTIIIDNISYF